MSHTIHAETAGFRDIAPALLQSQKQSAFLLREAMSEAALADEVNETDSITGDYTGPDTWKEIGDSLLFEELDPLGHGVDPSDAATIGMHLEYGRSILSMTGDGYNNPFGGGARTSSVIEAKRRAGHDVSYML